jgi:hypothetical protein
MIARDRVEVGHHLLQAALARDDGVGSRAHLAGNVEIE